MRSSEVRCEVQKFISEFTSQFVNKGCDWLRSSMKPIKCLVYKPACEFCNELLNFALFATNFGTSQRTSEYFSEKLSENDCKELCIFIQISSLYIIRVTVKTQQYGTNNKIIITLTMKASLVPIQ